MKSFSKKSISLMLVFTLLMAIVVPVLMPTIVNAENTQILIVQNGTDVNEWNDTQDVIMNAFLMKGLLTFDEQTGEVHNQNQKHLFTVSEGIITLAEGVSSADNLEYYLTDEEKVAEGVLKGVDKIYLSFDVMFEVNFETNGGDDIPSQQVANKLLAEQPSDPSRGEDVFIGWYSNIELTTPFDFDDPITGNTTVYAKWEKVEYVELETGTDVNTLNDTQDTIMSAFLFKEMITLNEQTGEVYDQFQKHLFTISDGIITLAEGVTSADDLEYALTDEEKAAESALKGVDRILLKFKAQPQVLTSANVTLSAPKVGDEVEKIIQNDGYGDYETQSLQPTVTTSTEGLSVNAFWVCGLGDSSEEAFYGTFDEDTYYYALIDFEADEGYELSETFPDGIKINGAAPDEVFAVMGGQWNHCVVKIKATTEETQNQKYTINSNTDSGDSIMFSAPDGNTYSFYIMDRKGTTDEQLQQIVELINDPELTFEVLKEQLNKLIAYGEKAAGENGTLLKLYEMYLYNNGIELHEAEGGFKLKLKMTDDMKGYDIYKLIYIAEDGTTEKAIELTKNGEYLEGILPHLSMYALVGEKATTTDTTEGATSSNPQTGDNIVIWINLMVISVLGIIGTIKFFKKDK